MSRLPVITLGVCCLFSACGSPPPERARITHFKADPAFIAAGGAGKVCFSVENATKLEIDPKVEELLPSAERCLDVSPKQTTTYTLTAFGADGKSDSKTTELKVGAPQPRISDLRARPGSVHRGKQVKVCFKVENAKNVRVSAGKLDLKTNCVTDYPKKTTTYKVIASGGDHEEDSGSVTVSVLR